MDLKAKQVRVCDLSSQEAQARGQFNFHGLKNKTLYYKKKKRGNTATNLECRHPILITQPPIKATETEAFTYSWC